MYRKLETFSKTTSSFDIIYKQTPQVHLKWYNVFAHQTRTTNTQIHVLEFYIKVRLQVYSQRFLTTYTCLP